MCEMNPSHWVASYANRAVPRISQYNKNNRKLNCTEMDQTIFSVVLGFQGDGG